MWGVARRQRLGARRHTYRCSLSSLCNLNSHQTSEQSLPCKGRQTLPRYWAMAPFSGNHHIYTYTYIYIYRYIYTHTLPQRRHNLTHQTRVSPIPWRLRQTSATCRQANGSLTRRNMDLCRTWPCLQHLSSTMMCLECSCSHLIPRSSCLGPIKRLCGFLSTPQDAQA